MPFNRHAFLSAIDGKDKRPRCHIELISPWIWLNFLVFLTLRVGKTGDATHQFTTWRLTLLRRRS
jgi:hypothetical protein